MEDSPENKVKVIGMGMSLRDLTDNHIRMIQKADVIAGGERHLQTLAVGGYLKKGCIRLKIGADIEGLVAEIRSFLGKGMEVVTIASGDPLFYGIGTTLLRHLGSEKILIFPNITSVGAAFSKIGESWADAVVISLHGKNNAAEIFKALRAGKFAAILTRPSKNPAWIANILMENGYGKASVCVLEQLGGDSEKVSWYTPEEAARATFAEPNLVIIRHKAFHNKLPALRPGSPESFFQHKNGLITKPEVRAVTLSKLELKSDSVFWDLGAGSGSVAIEASLFIKTGTICAVEKNGDRVKDIRANCERFGLEWLRIFQRELPDKLTDLPVPDRVFIGGGGRDLDKIIRDVSGRMAEGILVVNTVILENINTAIASLKAESFKTEIVQVSINFGHDMPRGEMMKAHNPVWIIKGFR